STTTLSLTGGVLTGPSIFTVSGATTWTGGNMSGTGQTIPNGSLAITANNQFIDTRTLTINAGATLTGTNSLGGFSGALITVANNSVFDIQSDASVRHFGGTVPTFSVAVGSTLRKSGGTGVSTISFILNSSGSVDVQTGTLQLINGGTETGSFTVAAGATLEFA